MAGRGFVGIRQCNKADDLRCDWEKKIIGGWEGHNDAVIWLMQHTQLVGRYPKERTGLRFRAGGDGQRFRLNSPGRVLRRSSTSSELQIRDPAQSSGVLRAREGLYRQWRIDFQVITEFPTLHCQCHAVLLDAVVRHDRPEEQAEEKKEKAKLPGLLAAAKPTIANPFCLVECLWAATLQAPVSE